MVVLVIVGLMTSAAVVLAPAAEPLLLKDARATARQITALQRGSVMAGQVYGADLRDGVLDMRRLSGGEWYALSSSDNGTGLENTFVSTAQLELNGTQVSMQDSIQSSESEFQPQIWFLPTGEYQPFRMIARSGEDVVFLDAKLGQPVKVIFND